MKNHESGPASEIHGQRLAVLLKIGKEVGPCAADGDCFTSDDKHTEWDYRLP